MSEITNVRGMNTLQGLQALDTGLQLASVAQLSQLQESSEILIEQNNKVINSIYEIGEKIAKTNELLKDNLEIQKVKEQRDLIENKIVDFIFELSKIIKNLDNQGITNFEKKTCADLILLQMDANEITTKNVHTYKNKELLQNKINKLEEFSKLKLLTEDRYHFEIFQRYVELEMINNVLTLNIDTIADAYPNEKNIKKIKKNQKAFAKKINELVSHTKVKPSKFWGLRRDFERDSDDYAENPDLIDWQDFESDDTSIFDFFSPILSFVAYFFALWFILVVLQAVLFTVNTELDLRLGFDSAEMIYEHLYLLSPYIIFGFLWPLYSRNRKLKAKAEKNFLFIAKKDLKKLLKAFENNKKNLETFENMSYISNSLRPNITRLFSKAEYKEFSDGQLFSNNLIHSTGHGIVKKNLYSSYEYLSKFQQLYEFIKKNQ